MLISRLVLIRNKRLSAFIFFALKEGWQVKLTKRGNVLLKRKGYAAIYNAAYLLENSPSLVEKKMRSEPNVRP